MNGDICFGNVKFSLYLAFVNRYTHLIRQIHPTAIIFLEPPVNEPPPQWSPMVPPLKPFDDLHYESEVPQKLKKDAARLVQQSREYLPPDHPHPEPDDPTRRVCYAPHWYDGITLMNKTFNKYWTVDYIGYKRGRYSNILGAVSVGIKNVRASFTRQLGYIRDEGVEFIGATPCIFGEIGIPFDMDGKVDYRNPDSEYINQFNAMNTNLIALESNLLNFTLWNYCPDNLHKWGDQWNGEDLSLFCLDTQLPYLLDASVVDFQHASSLHLCAIKPNPFLFPNWIHALSHWFKKLLSFPKKIDFLDEDSEEIEIEVLDDEFPLDDLLEGPRITVFKGEKHRHIRVEVIILFILVQKGHGA